MKKIILSAIYLFISVITFAQTNPVKVADFFADFEIKPYNGDVMDTVYNTGVDVMLPVFVRFKLKVPYGSGNVNTMPQQCYASIMYEHANGFDFNPLPNNIYLNANAWTPLTGSLYSPYVKVDLTLYKEYLKSGKLKTYYMSEYDAVNRGWQNRLQASSTRNITVIQVPNFIGPNQICDEATYTIERPDVVTLENAVGVAMLTALGNNQWKVTRIGTANGSVKLRSTSNGKTFDKDIVIGTPAPTISGTSQINTVGEYGYIVSRNLPGSTIEYNLMLGGDVELIPVSDTQFMIKVVNPNTSGSTMAVKVRARETNSCGTSSYTIKNITLNGNM
ncbi:hypothetical protein AAW12_05105 [Sphingobacterium sp. Ag1]|uniref:hypothetical protein n=1 Tax=Sphingobacterium sp. Ag1 TaxID=1643451 RepID=UPI000627A182|nr:hypothetical protein [Sphingobacterium sp. Ag1]KKO92480.1 hypothetical protein AAW12_05105 [Sphingobacterium sp. Ag1]